MSEMMSDEQIEQSGILETIFGDALPKVRAFYEKLKSEGEPRGLIGPRDVDILWERHLLNSAAVVPFIRQATSGKQFRSVADIGSGGGFPGLVAAAMLPDHTFTLIEPMERRCEWLSECVETMGLENVQIVRARSEEAIAALEQARGKSSGRGHAKNTVTPEVAQAIRHPFRGDLPGGRADDEADRMDIAARGAAWRAHCAEGTLRRCRNREGAQSDCAVRWAPRASQGS